MQQCCARLLVALISGICGIVQQSSLQGVPTKSVADCLARSLARREAQAFSASLAATHQLWADLAAEIRGLDLEAEEAAGEGSALRACLARVRVRAVRAVRAMSALLGLTTWVVAPSEWVAVWALMFASG